MHYESLVVEVRDKALNRLGQIPLSDLNILFEDQFNNVGSWAVQIRSDHEMAAALRAPGSGLIISDIDGTVLGSGPSVNCRTEATIQQEILIVEGVTDSVILADRLAFPDPSDPNPVTSNHNSAHDVRTGNPEALMHQYVSWNIGPNAPSARRDTRLQMGTNGNRGSTLTKRARFPVLGNLLAELALPAHLGFRVIQVGNHLEFQTYAVVNRSADVRFDVRNNMLSGHTISIAPPTVTRAVVAGQGDLTHRRFVEVTSSQSLAAEALWGRRIEQFIDQRQAKETDELTKAGEEAIADGGFAQLAVKVVPMEDMGATQYGHEWQIGDTVTVVVDGVEMPVLVTGYVLKRDRDGFRFGALLGDPSGANAATQVSAQVVKLDTRVSNLERNAEGSGYAVMLWNGTAYVAAPDARHYIGPADPASFGPVADGSTWDEVDV